VPVAVPQGKLPIGVAVNTGAVVLFATAMVCEDEHPLAISVIVTVYIPAAFVVITEVVAPVLQVYVTATDDVAVRLIVLVEGEQPIPIEELLLTFKLGIAALPLTGKEIVDVLQPVTVSVITIVYKPL